MTVPDQGSERDRLLKLLRSNALLRGDFVLSSGQPSSYYLDARLVTLSAEGSMLTGSVFLDDLPDVVQAVAGLTLGADPIVSAIAVCSTGRGRQIDGLIVRRNAKAHGTRSQIEGPFVPGIKVAIVDDTLTTGRSALDAADAIRVAGAQVVGVWSLIDREQGAREAIEAAGLPYHPFFVSSEITG